MSVHDDAASPREPVGTRVEASGPRSAAVRGNSGTIVTGDLHAARRPPLPAPAQIEAPAGLLGLPRRPAPWFVGRDEARAMLAATLEAGAGAGVISQAVVGLGGIGKSELALQYGFARRLDYGLVWWIDADSPAQIQIGLAGLARALVAGSDSVAAGQASPEEAAAWAITWLAGRTGWLLIFDNVEEPTHVEPYLARLTSGHVLITTRRDVGWRQLGATPLRLDTLPRPASIRLLGDLIGPPHAADAAVLGELAEELGDLPLALTQAGAYITVTPRCTPAGYLRLLRRVPERMLATAAVGGDAERVVAKAWEVSRARVAEQNPLAERLLQLLACYAPDHLPASVLAGADDDEQAVNEALALLASYSLITLTTHPADPITSGGDHDVDDGESVSIHRLTQAVIWHQLTTTQRDQTRTRAATLLDLALPADPEARANWPRYLRLLPHTSTITPPGSHTMNKVIDFAGASGDYTTAKTLQQARYTAQAETLGPEHPGTLTARANLAHWTGRAGNVAAARALLAELLPISERVFGPEHPDTLTDRANLARWTGQVGEAAVGRALYAELLPIRERVSGPEHPETLIARAHLAYWTGEAGDAAAARALLADLLPIRERVLGPEHPETLTARAHLAYWSDQAEARRLH
ncbi:tetratricopeptide repeat protein [Nonomuraea sp. NPDC059023]|uniref:tetratricopeptide repeat protein n=1 Tax=Nonomuraea sp. NPDC059023 TaxID=3346706 RepID=UPI003691BE49